MRQTVGKYLCRRIICYAITAKLYHLQIMAFKKRNSSEIKIDEGSHIAETSIITRFLNALYAIVLGTVLVQGFYLFTGSGSVVVLFDNILFLSFLAVCSIFGWIAGDSFIAWLKDEISVWKFW